MTDSGSVRPEDDLTRYLDEVRTIRRTLVEAEGRFRLYPWAYHVFGAVVLAGTGLNWVLAQRGLTQTEALLLIWLPATFLGGVVEMVAWLRKSSKENVPMFVPGFRRYTLAISAYLVGAFAIGVVLVRAGILTPGAILVLVGMMACIPVQYTHEWFLAEGLAMIACGIAMLALGANGAAYYAVAGLLVAAAMFGAGLVESALLTAEHGSDRG